MYSVVLLMAVTAGGESADFGRKGGCCGSYGCCGYTSCIGSYGCCGYSGCHGCRGGLFRGHHRHGCCGYSGCCGTVIYSGCCGTAVPKMAPPTPDMKGKVSAPGETTQQSVAAPATVVVSLPATAVLTIDGEATTSKTATRMFVTPTLTVGKTYSYTLRATYTQDGKPVVVTRDVAVRAGMTARVTLSAPVAVASR